MREMCGIGWEVQHSEEGDLREVGRPRPASWRAGRPVNTGPAGVVGEEVAGGVEGSRGACLEPCLPGWGSVGSALSVGLECAAGSGCAGHQARWPGAECTTFT